jgi:transcriptional regulator with XRE-family HTH domain
MAIDNFLDLLAYGKPRPNKFTIFMGNQIKKARLESGLSQEELAARIYKRRATVSDIENGKGEVDTSTFALLSHILDKPLGYFYPRYLYQEITQEDLTPLENELLINFREIWDEHLQSVAINQVKSLSEFNPIETLQESLDLTKSEKEIDDDLQTLFEKRHKKTKPKIDK